MAQELANMLPETMQNMKQFFIFADQVEVKEFLDTHPYLFDVLLEAHIRIRHFFPAEQLTLEMVSFRQSIGGRQLRLSIEGTGSMFGALITFSQFKNSWWFYAHHPYDGLLAIHVQHKDMSREDP